MDLKTQTTCKQFDVSAKAVICRGNHVLLLRRACGRWDLPGGRARRGEGVIKALRREIREETGLVMSSAHPLLDHKRKRTDGRDCHTIWFHCLIKSKLSEKSILLSAEHMDFAFVSFEDVGRLRLRMRHKQAINEAWHLLTLPAVA